MRKPFRTTIKRSLVGAFALLVLNSCGGNGQGSANVALKISKGATVSGTALPGGITFKAVGSIEGSNLTTELSMDLGADESTILPFGTWTIHVMGFTGPGAWAGTITCGSVGPVVLNLANMTLDITLENSKCSLAPFPEILASKLGVWDSAKWNLAKWAP